MLRSVGALFTLLLWTASHADTDGNQLLQQPALSETEIVFVHAGDLWSVNREGGSARRLTTGTGTESGPRFSPDGSQVAFTGEYDGNVDAFVVPAAGGVPRRLTWHPEPDRVLGWTPDGTRILISSSRSSYSRFAELFSVGLDGGLPERLPLPMGFEGSYSPDGARLAYVPLPRVFDTWKRYRGGTTTPIWVADLATSRVEEVPRENSNDYEPMWVGDAVYFLSDRNGPVTLFRYDVGTRQIEQVVENQGLDLKSASAGPGGIVYEQFGTLHLYDTRARTTTPVPVTVAGDMPEVRERLVNVAKALGSPDVSPSGARAVFEARGEVLTVPAEKGDVRNLTRTPGVMEREPVWSPDGTTLAYFSDASGEYELHLRDQSGSGETRTVGLGEEPAFYSSPRWSPDGTRIAYLDCHLGIWYVDLEDRTPVRVDTGLYWSGYWDQVPSWSPDGRWLAYEKKLPNYMGAIQVYSLTTGEATQVTDGLSDAKYPVFDKDGKHLYFTASTDSGPSMQPDIHSMTRPVTRSVYLLVLSRNDPSPLAPESDEEGAEKETGEEKDADEENKKEEAPPEVRIDFEGIGQRILAVPMPARRYVGLEVGEEGVLYAAEAPGFGSDDEELTIHRFSLEKRRADIPVAGVRAFEVSHDGRAWLLRREDAWTIVEATPVPDEPDRETPAGDPKGKTLKTADVEVRVTPRAEWRQMFHEAWRIERDFFYDPNHHGLDLEAAERRYEPYLAHLDSREDLNYLFSEMLGELTVGHLRAGGGDTPEARKVKTGLLGADYELSEGRYRFARVYDGEIWHPDLMAPLTQPGVSVTAGEYLLAVDGRELRGSDNVYRLFEGTADEQVRLKVGPRPDGTDAREVTVVPVESESRLRHLAWIEGNRRKVDEMTNGRVAYVYMPDTSFGGYQSFTRYFFAQVGKEAAIIDERFNAGGMLATDIVEILNRKLMSLVATRDGADEVQPQGAIFGPKVMIINELAGSGGDAMPWYFRRAGTGTLVGKRTWGGLVGRAGAPRLMDGGFVSAPSSAVWNPNGQWEVENAGVAPDVEVEHDPELVRQGRDPQLETAVEIVMKELRANPLPRPKRPSYPNYHGRTE